jgi:hypothetical protein
MKKVVILVSAMMMFACGSGSSEFASVGKEVDVRKMNNVDLMPNWCNYQIRSFMGKDDKKGGIIDSKIAIPAVFDRFEVLDCNEYLFLVEKNGKIGLVEAFKKGYILPCEFELIQVDLDRRLLYIQKPDEAMETYSFDTRKKWEGIENWPPKRFPADVLFKVLGNFPYWKVESISCDTRCGNVGAGCFVFTMKGVGLEDWNYLGLGLPNFFQIYLEKDGSKWLLPSGMGRHRFPPIQKGQPFEVEFSIADWELKDVNDVKLIIDK